MRQIQVLKVPQLDISSSDLRERVAEGRPIAYQVPRSVEEYINAHGLYGSDHRR